MIWRRELTVSLACVPPLGLPSLRRQSMHFGARRKAPTVYLDPQLVRGLDGALSVLIAQFVPVARGFIIIIIIIITGSTDITTVR